MRPETVEFVIKRATTGDASARFSEEFQPEES
jgi:hypothetical protein